MILPLIKKPLESVIPKIMTKCNHSNGLPLEQRITQINQQFAPELKVQLIEPQAILILLNRPKKKNALSFEMMKQLIRLAEELKTWADIRAVVLKGSEGCFCTGIDLADLNQPKQQGFAFWELIKPTQSLFQRVCLIWQQMPFPVIAVLEEYCIGAGLQLALACDIRIATPDCQLAIMESKWGLVPDMGLSQSALGLVNADILKELAMTAKTLSAKQAYQLGLVTYVDNEPMAQTQRLLTDIAKRSPDAVLASKRLINRMYAQSSWVLYQEKFWQLKLLMSRNRKLAIKKAKDNSVQFIKRQFD